MKLHKLRLTNFRCFSDIELELNERLTVLVAENGQGKSALLDALRIALWSFVSCFDIAKNAKADSGNGIAIADVRLVKMRHGDMARQLPAEVAITGDYGSGEPTTWVRYRDKEAKSTQTKEAGESKSLKDWARSLQAQSRDAKQQSPVTLPVFGYYGTGRLWSQKKLTEAVRGKDDTKEDDFYVRTFAYLNCLDPASSYKHFKEWFIWAFESWREQQINKIEGRANAEELQAAEDRVRVVQQAIDTFLKPITGWHTLEYSVSREKSLILLHNEQGTLDVEQLSDGIRNVLAMVGDIAYRCIKLNPHLGVDAARKTFGVVMIDEVDMHLHPRWQQVVLGQLQEAFANVQFVVTTHSPQVLSTVPSESIRILSSEWDEHSGQQRIVAHTVTRQTQGVASSDLLAEVMGTDPMPNIDIARQLSRYMAMIQQDLESTHEALQLRAVLEDHYGEEHPQMLECGRLMRLQAFKRRRSSRDDGEGG